MDTFTLSTFLEYNPQVCWMVFGGLLLLLEALAVPGAGLLFAGLSALTVGGLMGVGIIPQSFSLAVDIALFFVFTAVWAAILWKPFKKFRSSAKGYHNMVGTHADVLGEGLRKGKAGQVKWSGAPMRARIAETSAVDFIEPGTEVWVHALENSVLVVDVTRPTT